MSEFKGTPGPWIADGDEIFSEDTDSHIAVISSWLNEDITDANATLIAAAPELLEACLRIQAQFRQAGITSVAGSLNPVEDSAAQIDAVILKALGE